MAGFVEKKIKMGAELPRVGREKKLIIIGFGELKSERALLYSTVTTKSASSTEYAIPFSAIKRAYDVLIGKGSLTLKWFEKNEPDLMEETSISFRAMASLFVLNGMATRKDKDTYRRVRIKKPKTSFFRKS